MRLYIKNMVCIRCCMVVRAELDSLEVPYTAVQLGHVDTVDDITPAKQALFKAALLCSGLELMDNKKSVLIEKIKGIIVEQVHYSEKPLAVNYSVFLNEKLGHDYTYLANLFSEVEGTTIEKFIIMHKIERVKELLIYDELNLTEISYLMHYSNVSHLSAQFKKVTGLTPSHFKKLKNKRRDMLDDL